MSSTRVHILATELGVKSTAIIKKCQDEGLDDIKNHMTTISAGLAETIREWFSEGEHKTAIETTEKVDLEKVRIKKKVRQKPKEADTEETQTDSAVRQLVSVAGPRPAIAAPEVVVEQPVQVSVEAKIAQEQPMPPAAVLRQQDAGVVERPKPKPAVPKPIVPAGPMLERPKPAKLEGPKVVRVEAIRPARGEQKSIPKPKPRYNEPLTEPLISEDYKEGPLAMKGKKGGPVKVGHKEKTVGLSGELSSYPEDTRKTRYINIRRQRDIEERRARLEAAGGERLRLRPVRKIASKQEKQAAQAAARPTKVAITEPVSIKALSAALAVKASDIISKLLATGVMATANDVISNEVAELVAIDFGCELTIEQKMTIEDQIRHELETKERKTIVKRPVVATMLGHVDHGKTSLLDKIRSTNVTATEAGGITQHIGAYQVKVGESKVTFLDTPGHKAFTAMRARGANMTDVVVLVVAADDGVMPQTIEAIAHSKAAGVPVIVALNKIDLPGTDINRIYAQFAEHGLTPIEWGGDTDVVKTSAITGQGINDLLEHIDYTRDVLDLKADDSIPATGWVVEAKMSPQRGVVATLLIKEGRLNKGDAILAGGTYGRLKSMTDSFGKNIKTATSAMPVEITGLGAVPQAGDRFYCLENDINRAKMAADETAIRSREKTLAKRTQITLDNLFSQIAAGNIKELGVIIRADVQGSVDVLTKYLAEMSTEEVKIKILHAATGGITEGDVVLAEASNAIIIGFNVVADEQVGRIAESKGIDIRTYTIIYRITEDLKKSMVGLLEPEQKEKSLGKAQVREIFKVSKVGTVAGCYVNDGVVKKSGKVRLVRDNIVIRDALAIETLKHFKDDAREVKAGLECGIKLARFDDLKVGDVLDLYEIVEVARTLE